MTHDERLEALRMELARQDQALEDAMRSFEGRGDVPVPVDPSFLRELAEACEVRAPQVIAQPLVFGIRG
jgi:hypothetical protein